MDKQRLSRSASSAVKPSDFVNWEREAPPAPVRDKFRARDAAPQRSEPARPLAKSAARDAILPSAVDKSVEAWPAISEPAYAKPQAPAGEPADTQAPHKLEAGQHANETAATSWPGAATADGVRPSRELTATEIRKADETLYELFSSKSPEAAAEGKPPRKKWMIFAAVGAAAILIPVVLILTLGHHDTKAATKPSAQPFTVAADTGLQAGAEGDPSNQGKPDAAKRQAGDQTANPGDTATSQAALTQKQAKMMSDQLNAPRVISQDARKQMAENAPPPSIGAAGAEGLGGGGSMGSVFNGAGQSVKVTPSKALVISSGVANGMLVQKTPPVYPPIARTARVSGTVELHATISKTGTIKDLYVVSGPTMLRTSALDAVRNWRYRPYTLNDQPTEVETTIAVVFNLNN